MIHAVLIVAHQGTIPTLRDDYLGVRYMDYLRLLVCFFVFSVALTLSLPMALAAFCVTLSLLRALFLRLTQIGHRGLLLFDALTDRVVELGGDFPSLQRGQKAEHGGALASDL